ncbi:MAG: hypothetical protein ABR499_13830 [Gemmatimonadaceae bacterium]
MTTTQRTPSRARLGRYTLWHLRDYLREKGVATLVTLCLLGYLNYLSISRARALGAGENLLDQVADRAFVNWLGSLGILGVLFATNGIVADDRRHGYYRLLFAKPVSVVQFYAHKFAAYGVGFMIVAALLLGIYNVAVERFFPAALLPTLGLVYVALGGIGFLLSAAWRFDWLSLATVLLGSRVVWELFGDGAGPAGVLVRLLPPVHRVDGVYAAVRAGETLPVGDLMWLAAYGVACFIAGLVVVRWRPLAAQ